MAEYEKIKGLAWDEYLKIQGPAWVEYEKACLAHAKQIALKL